jgi:excisionase family DNA binding protein
LRKGFAQLLQAINLKPKAHQICERPETVKGLPDWVLSVVAQSIGLPTSIPPEADRALATLEEASTLLRISPRTLRRMVKSDKISAIRIDRQLRFDRDIF